MERNLWGRGWWWKETEIPNLSWERDKKEKMRKQRYTCGECIQRHKKEKNG